MDKKTLMFIGLGAFLGASFIVGILLILSAVEALPGDGTAGMWCFYILLSLISLGGLVAFILSFGTFRLF